MVTYVVSRLARSSSLAMVTYVVSRGDHVRRLSSWSRSLSLVLSSHLKIVNISIILGTAVSWDWYLFPFYLSHFFVLFLLYWDVLHVLGTYYRYRGLVFFFFMFFFFFFFIRECIKRFKYIR